MGAPLSTYALVRVATSYILGVFASDLKPMKGYNFAPFLSIMNVVSDRDWPFQSELRTVGDGEDLLKTLLVQTVGTLSQFVPLC